MRINRRKLGTSYTCLCQCMLFSLLQSIVEVPGSEPEISHPKFTLNQRSQNRLSSVGANALSLHLHIEMEFRESQEVPRVQGKEEVVPGSGTEWESSEEGKTGGS